MVWLVVLTLIFAQGNGLVISKKDVEPYKKIFYRIYGHYPESYDEKMEVLMNCLSDKLILKRARDIKITEDPEFQRNWERTKEYIEHKCRSEHIDKARCDKIKQAFFRIMAIEATVEKEVGPLARKEASKNKWLIYTHENLKSKIPPKNIEGYIKEISKLKALNAYIEKLMKVYRVKINTEAIQDL